MSIVEVRLTVPSDEFELGQILHDGPDVRVQLTQIVPTGDTFVPYFWVDTSDPEPFAEMVEADERVASLTRLDDGPDQYMYNIEWATPIDGFLQALADHDLVIEQAVGTHQQWEFRLRGPDHENLSEFRESLREHGITSTVNGVWHPTAPANDPYGLSEKQRDALELAFTEGYFEVPSETNLTELAEIVGITRQSFSRRLTRGLRRLLETTVMASP